MLLHCVCICIEWSQLIHLYFMFKLLLIQVIFVSRYRKQNDRGPLIDAMNLLLPLIYQLCVRLLPDESEQSVLLQKQILKIYFALIQVIKHLTLCR